MRTRGSYAVVSTWVALASGACVESPIDPEGVENQSPSALISAHPTEGVAPLAVAFDATESSDPDGTIASYQWSFGDGTPANGSHLTYVYWRAGTHTALLTVTDDDGAVDRTSVEIRVEPGNRAPRAALTATPARGFAPLEVTFDGAGSGDPDGSLVSYDWGFGDGAAGTGVNATHVYGAQGTYEATLTVMDDDGATHAASVEISVLGGDNSNSIAFASYRGGSEDLYVMAADGTAVARLTDGEEDEGDPAWAPNGAALAFRRANEIWIMNADGSRPDALTRQGVGSGDADSEPAWSPDGARVAFTRNEWWWGPQVWVVGLDGSNSATLTEGSAGGFAPAWSPDGTRIVYSAWVDDDLGDEVFLMGADGSNPVNLTDHRRNDSRPAWSPDGTRVAFVSDREGNSEVYVMDADGSNAVNLTRHPAWDSDPAWSPDGTRIAFATRRDGNAEIYVMGADGSDPVNLTNHPSLDHHPSWAR